MTAGITGIASSSSTTTSSNKTDNQEIAGNFQQFLTLLTTQLKNQSPLDPMDTNQFTQQLVMYAQVEQQLKSNDRLTTIADNTKATNAATATNLVGQSVSTDGKTTKLSGGKATWQLTPAKDATKALITIKDSNGNVLATQQKALMAGQQSFTWDGRTSSGATAPDGSYSVTVDAVDASAQTVAVSTAVSGKVDSVDLSGSEPVLMIGTTPLPLSMVRSIGGLST